MDIQDVKNQLLNFAEDYKKEMSANAYEFVGQMVQSIDHEVELNSTKK